MVIQEWQDWIYEETYKEAHVVKQRRNIVIDTCSCCCGLLHRLRCSETDWFERVRFQEEECRECEAWFN